MLGPIPEIPRRHAWARVASDRRVVRDGGPVRPPVRRRALGRPPGGSVAPCRALALADPVDRPRALRGRRRGPRVVLRPLRPRRPWHAEPDGATRGPRDGRAVRVDAESDCDVARRRAYRPVRPRGLRVRGGDCRGARRAGPPRDAPRRGDPRGPVRRRLPGVRGPRPTLAPAAAPTS